MFPSSSGRPRRVQGLGFRLPLVETSRDTNGGGCWMGEFKSNRHEFGAGAAGVIVVMIMFHKWNVRGG